MGCSSRCRAPFPQQLIEFFNIDTRGKDTGSVYHAIANCFVELADEADERDANALSAK